MGDFTIREITEGDRGWLHDFFTEHWGSPKMVYSKGIHQCDRLPGFVVMENGKVTGVLTYKVDHGECEIASLDSLEEGKGIGSTLIRAVEDVAADKNIHRIWLITTNDNLDALRFYQKRGFRLVKVHRNAVERARKIKPEIPLYGNDNIKISDEIELEKLIEI